MNKEIQPEKKARHILALSGGKDSAALAVFMKENHPELEMEYVFTDSGCELPETYEYLDRIRAVLNIDIVTIKPEKTWDKYWALTKVKATSCGYTTYLPSPKNRWCTEVLKLIPYEKWLMDNYPYDEIHSYVGLRADEKRERKGLISKKVAPHYPFIDNGFVYEDICRLLNESGLGFPGYYEWRSRSGCYFCFYQTKREWLGLYKHHRKLFEQAMRYETVNQGEGISFTWCDDISLAELIDKAEHYFNKDTLFENTLIPENQALKINEKQIAIKSPEKLKEILVPIF